MIKLQKEFGNTGLQIDCWKVAQYTVNPDEDTVQITLHGYKDLATCEDPVKGHADEIRLTLEGVEAILSGAGTHLENIESAVLGHQKFISAERT